MNLTLNTTNPEDVWCHIPNGYKIQFRRKMNLIRSVGLHECIGSIFLYQEKPESAHCYTLILAKPDEKNINITFEVISIDPLQIFFLQLHST